MFQRSPPQTRESRCLRRCYTNASTFPIAVGSRPCDAAMLTAADVSRNGRVTSLDALMIRQAAGGRIEL